MDKLCNRCAQVLPLDHFGLDNSKKGLRRNTCRACCAIRGRTNRRALVDIWDTQVGRAEPSTKTCSRCQEVLNATEEFFCKKRYSRDGLSTSCKGCDKQLRDTPARQEYILQYRYGITLAEYNRLLSVQGGVCAICQRDNLPLAVDHNHTTGKVRGLLCANCNRAIGLLDESSTRLAAACSYLEAATVLMVA